MVSFQKTHLSSNSKRLRIGPNPEPDHREVGIHSHSETVTEGEGKWWRLDSFRSHHVQIKCEVEIRLIS